MSESSYQLAPASDSAPTKTSLPHSLEAEQAVLGGLMLDNKRLDMVLEVISETDFFREDHRLILRMMLGLQENSQPLDVITLAEELDRHGELERRSEEHTSELQSRENLVCRLLLEKKKNV